jgi:hypothetical protein
VKTGKEYGILTHRTIPQIVPVFFVTEWVFTKKKKKSFNNTQLNENSIHGPHYKKKYSSASPKY